MRELERDFTSEKTARSTLAIVGQGRMGTALAAALREGPDGSPASRNGRDGIPAARAGREGTAALREGPDGSPASRNGRDGIPAARAGREETPAAPGCREETPASRNGRDGIPASRNRREVYPAFRDRREVYRAARDGRESRAARDGRQASAALRDQESAFTVLGPLGRGSDARAADAVLLCVPDSQIADAAALIAPGRLVGHCSGATGLDALAPHEAFSMHPLMTVAGERVVFEGAGAAVDGTTPRAVSFARQLASALGLRAVRVPPEDRALYHAAASIASNFLVTLEDAAERLAAETGVERDLLVPLVRATIENWADLGAERALTGPVARGDEATVARQREAIADRAPEILELFDALVVATRSLAAGRMEAQPA